MEKRKKRSRLGMRNIMKKQTDESRLRLKTEDLQSIEKRKKRCRLSMKNMMKNKQMPPNYTKKNSRTKRTKIRMIKILTNGEENEIAR